MLAPEQLAELEAAARAAKQVRGGIAIVAEITADEVLALIADLRAAKKREVVYCDWVMAMSKAVGEQNAWNTSVATENERLQADLRVKTEALEKIANVKLGAG